MRKKIYVFCLTTILFAICFSVCSFADVFSISEDYAKIYSNGFDGKTSAQIYAEWDGAHAASRTTVVADGGLYANWDMSGGVGYSFKKAYMNVRYSFDIKSSCVGMNSCVALRTDTQAGRLFGGIASTDVSEGNGIGFYFYDNTHPGQVALVIANSGGEVLSKSAIFYIDYPEGVTFKEYTSVDVYDYDDRLLFYIENQPFAAIQFFGRNGDLFGNGVVYNGSGTQIGTFNKSVRRTSKFGITNRDSAVYMDNFEISLPIDGDDAFRDIYNDNFDGANQTQIYQRWDGAHAAARVTPVNEKGQLWANWDLSQGVGYVLKQSYRNARYDFEIASGCTGMNACVALRTSQHGGYLFGGIASTDVSKGYGVGFYFYDNTHPGQAAIVIADAGQEVLSKSCISYIPYPDGVTFKDMTKVSVYDMDDRIFFLVDGKLFAYILFGDLSSDQYTSGNVYKADGTKVGSFSGKKIARNTKFAITNRDSTVYMDNFSVLRLIGNQTFYAYNKDSLVTVYEDDFDEKTAAQIYADWGGAHAASRPNPVDENGMLMCDWSVANGVGYAFKKPLINAVYTFDLHMTESGAHNVIALRTPSNAGGLYGGIASGETDKGRGVGIHVYNSASPYSTTILFADSANETLSTATQIHVPYRDLSLNGKTMTICDLDSRIICFVNGEPYFSIVFSGRSGEYYTSGIVYDAASQSLGSFSGKKIPRSSNFGFANRGSRLAIDNFKIERSPSKLTYVGFHAPSVPFDTSLAEAMMEIPDLVSVTFEDGTIAFVPVKWSTEGYNGKVAGTYPLTGVYQKNMYGLSGTIDSTITVLPKTSYTGTTQIYQLGPSKLALMMGYVIKTKTGKLIVIDGGLVNDNAYNGYLYGKLQEISGKSHPVVDAWILTHMHDDHMTEFIRMGLNHAGGITVKKVIMKFPDLEWYTSRFTSTDYNSSYYPDFIKAYNNLMGANTYPSRVHAEVGDTLVVDDVVIHMLYAPVGTEPVMNDTSLVFRAHIDGQTVLFLGDMHYNQIADNYGYKLKSDIVQMAHHGQGGVDQNTYQLIRPDICLWPTPSWVWENASGIYQTTIVRGWMAAQGITRHYVVGQSGTQTINMPVTGLTGYRMEYTNQGLYPVTNLTAQPIYLNIKSEPKDNLVYLTALYHKDRCVSVKTISAKDFPVAPQKVFDPEEFTEESAEYSIKTYQWNGTGEAVPVGEITKLQP